MDIGTPNPVRHAGASGAPPDRHPRSRAGYSAGEFTQDALVRDAGYWSRGRQPLLVGAPCVFHALSHGIAELPEGDIGGAWAIDAQAAGFRMGVCAPGNLD